RGQRIESWTLWSKALVASRRASVPKPWPKTWMKRHGLVLLKSWFQGYARGDWAAFSKGLGGFLKTKLRPPGFRVFWLALFQRFGRIRAYRPKQASWLVRMKQWLLVYEVRFEKGVHCLHVRAGQQNARWKIVWWQIRRC
ncbi:MAG: hypothetical protein AAGJ35_03885, partial [Myxococcota bacterium]